MSCLDGHDRAGRGEQVGARERRPGAVVLLLLDRLAAEVGDDGDQSVDVVTLVVAAEDQVVVDAFVEVVGSEAFDPIAVEGVLEMLQGRRVVEDIQVTLEIELLRREVSGSVPESPAFPRSGPVGESPSG